MIIKFILAVVIMCAVLSMGAIIIIWHSISIKSIQKIAAEEAEKMVKGTK